MTDTAKQGAKLENNTPHQSDDRFISDTEQQRAMIEHNTSPLSADNTNEQHRETKGHVGTEYTSSVR